MQQLLIRKRTAVLTQGEKEKIRRMKNRKMQKINKKIVHAFLAIGRRCYFKLMKNR